MYIALRHCSTLRAVKEQGNLIYNKYWDLATGYLKLTVLNELL